MSTFLNEIIPRARARARASFSMLSIISSSDPKMANVNILNKGGGQLIPVESCGNPEEFLLESYGIPVGIMWEF